MKEFKNMLYINCSFYELNYINQIKQNISVQYRKRRR